MKFAKVVPSETESIENLTISCEDGFEVITMFGRAQPAQTSNLYPVTPNLPYSVTPNVRAFVPSSTVSTSNQSSQITGKIFHPLDGIPFKLSPILEMSTFNSDPILEDVKNTLSRVEKLLYSDEFKYDCRLEKDILRDG